MRITSCIRNKFDIKNGHKRVDKTRQVSQIAGITG